MNKNVRNGTREERIMRELERICNEKGEFRLAEEFHKALSPMDLSDKAYKLFQREIENRWTNKYDIKHWDLFLVLNIVVIRFLDIKVFKNIDILCRYEYNVFSFE